MKKALIHNGKVVQVSDSVFPVHSDMLWLDCDDDCTTKHIYIDGEFVEPAKTFEERKIELAALRYEKETGGIKVDGLEIKTDRTSQCSLLIMESFFNKNPNKKISFKASSSWKKITSTEFINILQAVSEHVQACFAREQELSELLLSDINTDITTGWPNND